MAIFQKRNMKKKYSLKRNEEIAKIVQKRVLEKNNCYVIYYYPNQNINHTRVCISVSKKLGKAVIRNKIKRQVREMVTSIFDFNLSYDFVIIIRRDYPEIDFEHNKNKLEKLYLRITSKIKGD